jgi:hypothetical protein
MRVVSRARGSFFQVPTGPSPGEHVGIDYGIGPGQELAGDSVCVTSMGTVLVCFQLLL